MFKLNTATNKHSFMMNIENKIKHENGFYTDKQISDKLLSLNDIC